MTDLPSGWAWTTLGEVCEVRYGKALPREQRDSSADVPVVGSAGPMDRTASALVADPCIVVGRKGNIGHPQIIERPCWPIDTTYYIRTSELISRNYLFHVLTFVDYAALNQSTTTPSLRREELQSIPVRLPPVPEQIRIIDALEDHLSRLDIAESSLCASGKRAATLRSRAAETAVAAQVDRFRNAARERLAEIIGLRGRLVAQRRKDPAPPAYELDLPDGWVTASVDQLCYQIQYGTSTKASPANRGADLAVLRMGNIQDGEIDVGSLKYISADDPSISDLLLEPGDLLFNRTNSAELVGKTAVFTDQLQCATFASYLIRCRTVPGVSAQWISYIANSSIGRRYIESVMSQQVGQANVNGTKLAAMPVPITGADAEGILVEEISELRRSSARFANEVSEGLTRSRVLRRSVLRAAFNGELVDQDPSDEPAEVALQRLRARPKPVRKRAAKSSAAVATES